MWIGFTFSEPKFGVNKKKQVKPLVIIGHVIIISLVILMEVICHIMAIIDRKIMIKMGYVVLAVVIKHGVMIGHING